MHGYWLASNGTSYWGIGSFMFGEACRPISRELHESPACTKKLWANTLFVRRPGLVLKTADPDIRAAIAARAAA